MSVNKLILKYLQDNKISQYELSKRTGILPQNLNRLLNADDIKLSQLKSISQSLELPITYFLEEQPTISKEEIESLRTRISDLESIIEDQNINFRGCAWVVSSLAKEAREFIENKNTSNEQFIDYLMRMEEGFAIFQNFIKDDLLKLKKNSSSKK